MIIDIRVNDHYTRVPLFSPGRAPQVTRWGACLVGNFPRPLSVHPHGHEADRSRDRRQPRHRLCYREAPVRFSRGPLIKFTVTLTFQCCAARCARYPHLARFSEGPAGCRRTREARTRGSQIIHTARALTAAGLRLSSSSWMWQTMYPSRSLRSACWRNTAESTFSVRLIMGLLSNFVS